MNVERRLLCKGLAGAAGVMLFAPHTWPCQAAAERTGGPQRVVFFLQNHGFHPQHATPDGLHINELALDKV